MGWTNDQATTLDGLAVSYTDTTINYGAGSAVAFNAGSTLSIPDANVAGTSLLSRLSTLSGQISSLTSVLNTRPRGIVGRNLSTSDLPAAGTTAGDPNIAATVLTASAFVDPGRIYRISCPGLTVRMNVDGRITGAQLTYTEDDTFATPTSTRLVSVTVTCPSAGVPQPCPIGATYVRSGARAVLDVLLSVWVIGAGVATTASGGDHGGDPAGRIELLIEDMGVDLGVSP